MPTLIYKANANQSEEDAPVVYEQNSADSNFLGSITWTYQEAGTYFGTKTGAFPVKEKVNIIIGNNERDKYGEGDVFALWGDENTIILRSLTPDQNSADEIIKNLSLTIEIYP